MKLYKLIVICIIMVLLNGCAETKEKAVDHSKDEEIVGTLEGYTVIDKEHIHDKVDKYDIDKYAYTLKKDDTEIVLYTSRDTLYNVLENGYVVNVSYNKHNYIIQSTIFSK